MNRIDRENMLQQLRESGAELREDIERRREQLESDPIAYDDFLRGLESEPLGASLVRQARSASGLVYRTTNNAPRSAANAADAARMVADEGDSLDEVVDSVIEAVGEAMAERNAELAKEIDDL